MLTEVTTTIDEVKMGVGALGDRIVKDERDMRKHREEVIVAMRLQLDLAVFGLKIAGDSFARFGPQNRVPWGSTRHHQSACV